MIWNARRREEFLNKKLIASTAEKPFQSEPAAVEEAEAPTKATSGLLHHHPSPSPSSERRQVITVGRERVGPNFSQFRLLTQPLGVHRCHKTTWFSHTTMVTTWQEWMTVEIKVCLPVTIASTCGEQRRKLTIVNAQPFMIAHLTVCLSMLLAKILIVTYRPVWPAVSALYYHQNIYPLMCIHWCHSNKNDLLLLL